MSETSHTPGPWTVDGPPHNQIVWSGPDERVCFLAHSNGRDDERDIATGRLIAAAPDLLEALHTLINNNRKCVTGQLARQGWAKAYAAISKAEGSQP